MAGKTKKQKARQAKIRKREEEERNHTKNLGRKKVLASQPTDVLGNGAEPAPPKINEDAEIPMETMEENVKRLEADKELETKPFDPMSVVANVLKKKNGA